MKSIFLQPTPIAQWYALVNEAQFDCQLNLTEELESYLVFMLMRFSEKSELSQNILAIEFLESLHKRGSLKTCSLQEVGDKCLLISGFFPEHIKKRRLKESYYIDLGQNAYYALANDLKLTAAELFKSLSHEFLILRGILQAMRPAHTHTSEAQAFNFKLKRKLQ